MSMCILHVDILEGADNVFHLNHSGIRVITIYLELDYFINLK